MLLVLVKSNIVKNDHNILFKLSIMETVMEGQ